MNLLQCSNMHYYDGDIHTECPYCKNPEKQQYRDITNGEGMGSRSGGIDRSEPLFENSNGEDDRTELQF